MSTSVKIDQIEQALVCVAIARLKIAAAIMTDDAWKKGTPVKGSASYRAIVQINLAIEELETNLPFTTKGKS